MKEMTSTPMGMECFVIDHFVLAGVSQLYLYACIVGKSAINDKGGDEQAVADAALKVSS
jgi:hypothetical protein